MSTSSRSVDWYHLFSSTLPEVIEGLVESSIVTLGKSVDKEESEFTHENPELCFILSGSVKIRGSRHSYRLHAPSLIAIGANLHHEAFPTTEDAEVLWMYTSPNHVSCWRNRVLADGGERAIEGFETLRTTNGRDLAVILIDEIEKKETAWLMRSRAIVTQLSILCLRAIEEEERFDLFLYGEQRPKDVVQRALFYINKHYPKQINVSDVADSVSLSPNYLTDLFKQVVGSTVSQYIAQVRIEKAQTLLRQTTRTIAEIAFDVGFHSPYYFSRVFKKHTGLTPRDYRSQDRLFTV